MAERVCGVSWRSDQLYSKLPLYSGPILDSLYQELHRLQDGNLVRRSKIHSPKGLFKGSRESRPPDNCDKGYEVLKTLLAAVGRYERLIVHSLVAWRDPTLLDWTDLKAPLCV